MCQSCLCLTLTVPYYPVLVDWLQRGLHLLVDLLLTLKVLVAATDAQWKGMGDVGSARYEPALLPPCPTIKVLSYSN